MFRGPSSIVSTMQEETTPIFNIFGMTGLIEKAKFYRHCQHCLKEKMCSKDKPFTSTAVCHLEHSDATPFKEDILTRFHDDNVRKLCQTDQTLIYFGQKQCKKRNGKQDKQDEVKKSVMTNKKRLAHRFIPFQKEFENFQKTNATYCDEISSTT